MASTGSKWLLAALLMLTSLLAVAHTPVREAFSSLEEGDLIFVQPFIGNDITRVTAAGHAMAADHVAIAHRLGGTDGPLYVIEAIGTGVCLTPIDTFCNRNEQALLIAARCPGIDAKASVSNALHYVGRPYDKLYQEGDNELYCSELVQLCLTDTLGNHLLPTTAMTFRDEHGNIPSHWVNLYASHNLPVPEGKPGTNPTQLLHDKHIVILFTTGKPTSNTN